MTRRENHVVRYQHDANIPLPCDVLQTTAREVDSLGPCVDYDHAAFAIVLPVERDWTAAAALKATDDRSS